MPRVLVAVGDDIIDDLVKRDVQGENDLVRELVAGGEVVDHVRHPRDLGQVVVDPDFAGCRQPGLRRHRGSSFHRCDKVLGDYSTHYSCLRGVCHRRNGVLLRDGGSKERQAPDSSPTPTAIETVTFAHTLRGRPPRLPTPRPRVYRGFPAPPTRWPAGMYPAMDPHVQPGIQPPTAALPAHRAARP